jgi:hypothetical protein
MNATTPSFRRSSEPRSFACDATAMDGARS